MSIVADIILSFVFMVGFITIGEYWQYRSKRQTNRKDW